MMVQLNEVRAGYEYGIIKQYGHRQHKCSKECSCLIGHVFIGIERVDDT